MSIAKAKWKLAQWAEIRWWKNYLHDKDTDTYLAWKKDYWKGVLAEIESVVSLPKSGKAADIGCGPTGMFMNLSNFEVTAVDPLLDAYAANLKQFNKAWYANVTFVTKPMEELTYDGVFDLLFCMNAINHVKELEKSYAILSKALKSGGYLVISIDAHNHSFYKGLFRLIPGDILHPHQYDLAEYEGFLTRNGFEVLHTFCKKKEHFFNHYIQLARKK